MAIQKIGDAQPASVFTGKEATVVSEHIQRLGKSVSDFSNEEKSALDSDLEAVREVNDGESVNE
jgi:hypothetical protein